MSDFEPQNSDDAIIAMIDELLAEKGLHIARTGNGDYFIGLKQTDIYSELIERHDFRVDAYRDAIECLIKLQITQDNDIS